MGRAVGLFVKDPPPSSKGDLVGCVEVGLDVVGAFVGSEVGFLVGAFVETEVGEAVTGAFKPGCLS